ncbi:MAG TPA: regulatory protein RecX [Symbiobacteriaceae bacterium]|nr:regulatory protein RecX [Symbiobacteriaceae bacterium]
MATSNWAGARFGGPRVRARTAPDLEALAQLSGRITAIEPQQKDPKRRSVFVDGEFVLGLHEETIILAKLKVGQQVDGPKLAEAVRRDEAKRAWDGALGYLGAAPRSRRDVERKLARRYPPEVVSGVIERLEGGGWLDDAEFAAAYVRSRSEYGERRLLGDLARKGVAREVAARVVRELLGTVDAVIQAREAAAGRLSRMPGTDRATAQRRLTGFLARRGYDFATISRALEPLLAGLPRVEKPARWGRREEL